jgi:hypothetical protein
MAKPHRYGGRAAEGKAAGGKTAGEKAAGEKAAGEKAAGERAVGGASRPHPALSQGERGRQPSLPPDPPKRHPWFLAVAALLMSLWLLFLLWMAVVAGR